VGFGLTVTAEPQQDAFQELMGLLLGDSLPGALKSAQRLRGVSEGPLVLVRRQFTLPATGTVPGARTAVASPPATTCRSPPERPRPATGLPPWQRFGSGGRVPIEGTWSLLCYVRRMPRCGLSFSGT
jgi:hypothetical protein